MGLLCVYAMFLIALSNIALAVLLALGPLFIAMLFFEATKRMFSAWIAQLANYALITILTVMVAALLLQIVQSYAAQTAARGSAIFTMDALNMVLIAVLVFLILRQIMPIAAALAGGIALSTLRDGQPHDRGCWSPRGGAARRSVPASATIAGRTGRHSATAPWRSRSRRVQSAMRRIAELADDDPSIGR